MMLLSEWLRDRAVIVMRIVYRNLADEVDFIEVSEAAEFWFGLYWREMASVGWGFGKTFFLKKIM